MDPEDITGGKGGSGDDSSGSSLSIGGTAAAGTGLIGLGLAVYGTLGGMKAASEQSQLSMQEAQGQEHVEQLKQQQMILQNNRQNIQNLRDVQKAQAMGKAAAVQGGALFGSGYAGGQSQAAAKGAYNAEGLSQNLQIGNQIFAQDYAIDALKMQQASVASKQATAQGWENLGASFLSGASKLASI